MNSRTVLLVSLIAGVAVYSSMPSIGFLIIVFSLIGLLATVFSKKQEAKSGSSYKMGEEIVIESTKQLPYRIPSKMNLTYSPNSKQRKPWWTKVTSKGILPNVAKGIGKLLKEL